MLSLIILRSVDLILTYFYIPNLKNEYNPIVSIFGASWLGLISIQLIFIMAFTDFVYCYFYSKSKPWPQRMVSIPKNLKSHMIFNGFMFMAASFWVSFFAIISNYLLLLDIVWYRQFLSANYKVFFPGVFFIIVIVSFFLFFKKQYSKYLLQQSY